MPDAITDLKECSVFGAEAAALRELVLAMEGGKDASALRATSAEVSQSQKRENFELLADIIEWNIKDLAGRIESRPEICRELPLVQEGWVPALSVDVYQLGDVGRAKELALLCPGDHQAPLVLACELGLAAEALDSGELITAIQRLNAAEEILMNQSNEGVQG